MQKKQLLRRTYVNWNDMSDVKKIVVVEERVHIINKAGENGKLIIMVRSMEDCAEMRHVIDIGMEKER